MSRRDVPADSRRQRGVTLADLDEAARNRFWRDRQAVVDETKRRTRLAGIARVLAASQRAVDGVSQAA